MDFQPLIQEFGIDKLPEEKQQAILGTVLRTLQKRVGLRLAQTLSDEQVEQLEAAIARGDDAAEAELERVYPNFKQVYQEELDNLRTELRGLTPQQ